MTLDELKALAGGSRVNEDYLMEVIAASIKPENIRTILKIDGLATQDKIDEMVTDGIIRETTINGRAFLSVDWNLPYTGEGDVPDENLRIKCLEASDLIDRKLRMEEILSRLKITYGNHTTAYSRREME